MLPSNPSRLAACLIFTAISSALVGCKPTTAPQATANQTPGDPSLQTSVDARRHPSTEELANYVRSIAPPKLKLVDVQNDPPVPLPNSSPGSKGWLYTVRLTFAPLEDVLGAPTPQAAEAFQTLVDELGGLAAWSQAYARSPYASLYPGFTVDAPAPASPQLLAITRPKGRPLAAIYGKLAAEWQVDHWDFSVENLALPTDDGQFRSSFSGPILIQGEPEADRFIIAAKAVVAEAKPKRQAIEKAYQEDLRKAIRPGTLYKGTISFGGSATPAEVRFVDPPTGDPSFARFEMRLPATGYVYTVSAKLAARVPNLPVAATNSADPMATPSEQAPKGDLTIGYEHIAIPNPYPQNEFATNFMYHARDTKDAPLTFVTTS